jgi:DNA-binding response OmpR family regulator
MEHSVPHAGSTQPALTVGNLRILVVEDDPSMATALKQGLRGAGFTVWVAVTGEEALALWRRHDPDAVVLDLILPDMDGLDVCLEMRRHGAVPLIMASGRIGPADRVCGLELGADEYICKPFEMAELVARLRALMARCRRYSGYADAAEDAITVGPLLVDSARHEVLLDGLLIDLTPKEFDLLLALGRSANRTMTSRKLLWDVWGYDENIRTRTLDVHIGRLRRKLGVDAHRPCMIVTVPSVGYRLQSGADVTHCTAA